MLRACLFTFVTVVLTSFLAPAQDQVLDIDGNVYETLEIGDQTWMRQNLKVTRYRDGSTIPEIRLDIVWAQLQEQEMHGFSWKNYDDNFKNPYGGYYNIYAIQTGELCPFGWKVPTKEDWDGLIDSLGDPLEVGGWLKATGNLTNTDGLWQAPNTGANDSLGFGALPAGFLSGNGGFGSINRLGYYWSSTINTTHTQAVFLKHDTPSILRNGFSNGFGFSVRCLREKQ